jgi:hypothetical protein
VALPRRRGDAAVTSAAAELAQVALDEETITIIIAAVIGLGAGLGVPIFFVMQVRTTRLIPYRAFPRSARRDRPRASRPRPRDRRARAALTRFPPSTRFSRPQEERDKERLEEIRELNRATLKATGEQMSEEEIAELRPSRYLDRREFKDDD